MTDAAPSLTWALLTVGDRPAQLDAALDSIRVDDPSAGVIVLHNGVEGGHSGDRQRPSVRSIASHENLGIPGGRDLAVGATDADVVAFLDDDATLRTAVTERLTRAFAEDPQLGAVAFRIVDEDGQTARRHVPRPGGHAPEVGGDVALFLGGACAIRRAAYDDAGGYWAELFYGHEELELSWRLIDRGWKIRYLPEVEVFHPRTEISRHAQGWTRTGRNRVLIARRTLPWPVALVHVSFWLLLGAWRAPDRNARRAYLAGWLDGWRRPVDRAPIRWATVWRLTRLGRPPIV